MLAVLVYFGATIYFKSQDLGILYSLFFAIPTTPLVLIFGSIATGAISGLFKGIRNEFKKR
jgi:hypothetical protein